MQVENNGQGEPSERAKQMTLQGALFAGAAHQVEQAARLDALHRGPREAIEEEANDEREDDKANRDENRDQAREFCRTPGETASVDGQSGQPISEYV